MEACERGLRTEHEDRYEFTESDIAAFKSMMRTACLSYGAWLIENGIPEMGNWHVKGKLSPRAFTEGYDAALADVKAKMEELNV